MAESKVRRLTAAQRRQVLAADPVSGELKGTAAQKAALVDRGLAVARGRIGATYLNAVGLEVRAQLLQAAEAAEAPAGEGVPAGFTPATGDGPAGELAGDASRAAEVAQAWESLLEIRRVSGAAEAPAAWERARPVWAVALALEAAGLPPCATDHRGRRLRTGCRVLPGTEGAAARVEWRGPASSRAREEAAARLEECAACLAGRGWASIAYLASGGLRYLAVTPAR